MCVCIYICRSQCPRGLRRGSAAARLLGLCVRIPPVAWMSVSCECCVLSGRGSLRRADHSPRGVLPSVVCLSVIVKPRKCGGPGPLGAVDPSEVAYLHTTYVTSVSPGLVQLVMPYHSVC
jgi:hypothetical protein